MVFVPIYWAWDLLGGCDELGLSVRRMRVVSFWFRIVCVRFEWCLDELLIVYECELLMVMHCVCKSRAHRDECLRGGGGWCVGRLYFNYMYTSSALSTNWFLHWLIMYLNTLSSHLIILSLYSFYIHFSCPVVARCPFIYVSVVLSMQYICILFI